MGRSEQVANPNSFKVDLKILQEVRRLLKLKRSSRKLADFNHLQSPKLQNTINKAKNLSINKPQDSTYV
jgi:hypothetical protein